MQDIKKSNQNLWQNSGKPASDTHKSVKDVVTASFLFEPPPPLRSSITIGMIIASNRLGFSREMLFRVVWDQVNVFPSMALASWNSWGHVEFTSVVLKSWSVLDPSAASAKSHKICKKIAVLWPSAQRFPKSRLPQAAHRLQTSKNQQIFAGQHKEISPEETPKHGVSWLYHDCEWDQYRLWHVHRPTISRDSSQAAKVSAKGYCCRPNLGTGVADKTVIAADWTNHPANGRKWKLSGTSCYTTSDQISIVN